MHIKLQEVKEHLRIDTEFTYDDAYITSLIAVAEQAISNDIKTDISTFKELPAPIRHAMLLLIGDLYSNREDSNDLKLSHIPNGIKRLIAPYINYSE